MFRLIKQVFLTLLSFSGSLASVPKISDRIKCTSFNNQPSKTTVVNLNTGEYNQELCYYPFMINLIDIMDTVMLLTIYQVKYMFQRKQKIGI